MFTIPRAWEETAVIAASGTKSTVISNVGSRYLGMILPTMTGTATTFEVSDDGVTFVALNNSSGAVSLTTASSKAYKLPDDLAPFPYFKLVSGSTEAAERTIIIVRKS